MKRLFILSVMSGVLALSVWPKFSYADGGRDRWGHHGEHRYYHYRDHPHWGIHVDAFYPDEYYPVWVGGRRYYYDEGVYYDYTGGVYVVAPPPVGAVVAAIPSDFQPAVINGVTYYVDNGTYYVYTPSGYRVVPPPR